MKKNNKNVSKNKRPRRQLGSKVIALFALMAVIIDVVVVCVGYFVYKNDTIDSYGRICSGIAQVIVSSVDGNHVDEMFEGKEESEYETLKERMIDLLKQVPSVENVYLYDMQRDGMHLLLDTSDFSMPIGTVVDYPERLKPYIDQLTESSEIENFVESGDDGRIMTSLIPVFDVRDNCVCYAGCDIVMNEAYENIQNFGFILALIAGIPTLIVVLFAAFYVQKRIITPINSLDVYLSNYASGGDGADLSKQKQAFDKNASDELLTLRDNAMKMMNDVEKYSGAANKYRNNITRGIEAVMDAKNNTGERLEKYAEYVRIIMDELRYDHTYEREISDSDYEDIIRFAPLYDMGELFISSSIMNKKGKLTDEEYEKIKSHTVMSRKAVEKMASLVQDERENVILGQLTELHHERWDGNGYPHGLKGEEIPLAARIMAVVDVFNAIARKKGCKTSEDATSVFTIISQNAGKQFDPAVVAAFLHRRKEIGELLEKYADDNEVKDAEQ